MASSNPIACSNRGPMPEVLKDAGEYFNPENPNEIISAITTLIESVDLREKYSIKSSELSHNFNWNKTSIETFNYLYSICNCN